MHASYSDVMKYLMVLLAANLTKKAIPTGIAFFVKQANNVD